MKKKLIVGIGVIFVLTVGYLGIKMYAANVAEAKIDDAIASVADYADMNYKNASVGLFDKNVHIFDVVVSPKGSSDKVNIKEIVINNVYDGDEDSAIPSALDISFNGVEIAIDQLGNDAQKIKELGYKDNLLLNFAIQYHYNKENNKINLNKLKIGAANVGDLDINFRLGNIDLSPEKLMGILFTYPQIELYGAQISYHDDSLMERLFKLTAKEQKKSVEQIKNEAIKTVEKEIEKEEDEFTKDVLKGIKGFIENPENLIVSIAPKKPLSLGQLLRVGDPKDMIKLLNVNIRS
ncbi:MAG: hypothetical protein GY710_21715 [Desulfobacteraceae bacterium]|nr:hypothetical protein [Desulfobacteraceae bacterium]